MRNKLIATDINDFALLLESHSIIQDAKSLYDASSRLYNLQNENQWKYECGIKFSVEGTVGGSIPHGISLVEIIFNISVMGIFSDDATVISNPLSKLSFNIEIEGLNTNKETFYATWHLDKHEAGGNRPTYVHPEYHLTFGGNKLEEKGVHDFGAALILPTPRITYPPMDVILGIDFILQNYFPLERISKLLDESKYKEIVLNSQQRLWKPYYISLSSAWNSLIGTSFEKGFNYFNLNPHINQLVKY